MICGFTSKRPCYEKNGIEKEYAYNEMQGDHIILWSQGGSIVVQLSRQKFKHFIMNRYL